MKRNYVCNVQQSISTNEETGKLYTNLKLSKFVDAILTTVFCYSLQKISEIHHILIVNRFELVIVSIRTKEIDELMQKIHLQSVDEFVELMA